MRRFMLLAGMGMGLVAADACSAGPPVLLALVAARNAAATVRQLIEAGHDVDGRDARGATPLMAAARTGAVEAMIALLDAGADPDARDGFNHWTPLLHAIHKRQAGAVGLLLERGADPNARTESLPPLIMAAADRDATIVRLLLAHGADARARGAGGATALSQAVSGGALSDIDLPLLGGCHPETVRALKEHDPGLDLPDTVAGWNALWWAKFHGCREVIDLVRRS